MCEDVEHARHSLEQKTLITHFIQTTATNVIGSDEMTLQVSSSFITEAPCCSILGATGM